MRLLPASLILFTAATASAQVASPSAAPIPVAPPAVAAPALAAPPPALAAPPPTASPLSAADAAALLQRLDDLEQQHRILARQIELANEHAAVKARESGSVAFGSRGFQLRSADGHSFLRLGG